MVAPLTSVLVVLATFGVAQAQDLCANIDDLIVQSGSQFAEILDKPKGDDGDYDVTLALAGASYCSVTKTSKREFYHCGWEFPYRAKQAYDTFDAFVREVDACVGGQARLHSDQSVNHPDFYALRRYEMERAEVSVSVKDKSALGSTFVFIRVHGGAND
jgi:hypothetical protein